MIENLEIFKKITKNPETNIIKKTKIPPKKS